MSLLSIFKRCIHKLTTQINLFLYMMKDSCIKKREIKEIKPPSLKSPKSSANFLKTAKKVKEVTKDKL